LKVWGVGGGARCVGGRRRGLVGGRRDIGRRVGRRVDRCRRCRHIGRRGHLCCGVATGNVVAVRASRCCRRCGRRVDGPPAGLRPDGRRTRRGLDGPPPGFDHHKWPSWRCVDWWPLSDRGDSRCIGGRLPACPSLPRTRLERRESARQGRAGGHGADKCAAPSMGRGGQVGPRDGMKDGGGRERRERTGRRGGWRKNKR